MKVSAELEAKCLALAEQKTDLPPNISEAQFQWEIVKLARRHGWVTHHHFDSRKSEAGWPDLVIVKMGTPRVIFAELKVGYNRLTSNQETWAEILKQIGGNVEYYLWRPESWPQIEKSGGLKLRRL